MNNKTILTCAITGSAALHPKHPNFPVTPSEIADATIESAKAGASIAHIHVRHPETGGASRDPALFQEVVDRIRQSGTDIVLNLTCGNGATFLPDPEDESRGLPESNIANAKERCGHLKGCLPEIATLDVTTMNWSTPRADVVYLNTPSTLRDMARIFLDLDVRAEFECFQAGDVLLANQMIKEGLIDGPALFQFVLGINWGVPASPETILYLRNLLKGDCYWGAFGIGPMQFPMAAQSLLAGGNVRVGLEDNLYLQRGVFATNGQLVERAVRIIEDLGGAVATPSEARELMKLKNGP